MPNKAVLLDLENNMPTANILREIIEHYPTLYLFNCTGQFQYSLEDLTEFSGWGEQWPGGDFRGTECI